ncbi:hypothetical protein GCM10010178_80020 [Lentzea flava]|uniref:Uncharacterized protein n=1 Tax=Lentzea flava TaxID=103732 RepID=A0ABQ2VAF0_9PSEU|nr:hypothetical protein GCM10010178_80020 [Lentzea flava]
MDEFAQPQQLALPSDEIRRKQGQRRSTGNGVLHPTPTAFTRDLEKLGTSVCGEAERFGEHLRRAALGRASPAPFELAQSTDADPGQAGERLLTETSGTPVLKQQFAEEGRLVVPVIHNVDTAGGSARSSRTRPIR